MKTRLIYNFFTLSVLPISHIKPLGHISQHIPRIFPQPFTVTRKKKKYISYHLSQALSSSTHGLVLEGRGAGRGEGHVSDPDWAERQQPRQEAEKMVGEHSTAAVLAVVEDSSCMSEPDSLICAGLRRSNGWNWEGMKDSTRQKNRDDGWTFVAADTTCRDSVTGAESMTCVGNSKASTKRRKRRKEGRSSYNNTIYNPMLSPAQCPYPHQLPYYLLHLWLL